MRSSTVLAVVFVCFSVMAISEAFFFNDNMLWWLMLSQGGNMFGSGSGGSGNMGGSMPFWLLASGNDNMKGLGQGLLFSQMLGGGNQPSNAGGAPTMG